MNHDDDQKPPTWEDPTRYNNHVAKEPDDLLPSGSDGLREHTDQDDLEADVAAIKGRRVVTAEWARTLVPWVAVVALAVGLTSLYFSLSKERFQLSLVGDGYAYKIDKLTGQVWLVFGPKEMRVDEVGELPSLSKHSKAGSSGQSGAEPAKELPSGQPKTDLKQWRQLKPGLTPDEVKSLLGEPSHVEANPAWIEWTYPSEGKVSFGQGTGVLDTWEEPE